MFKYRWDAMQIGVAVCYLIFVICLLYFPYKLDIEDKEIVYGYKSLFHWILIIYMARVCLHVFGWEIFNLQGNLIGVGVIVLGSTYFKYLFGTKEGFEIMWSGFIIPILVFILVGGILFVDRFLYALERR